LSDPKTASAFEIYIYPSRIYIPRILVYHRRHDAARPSGVGVLAGGGGVWDVISVTVEDGDVLGCPVRRRGGDVRGRGGGGAPGGVDTAAEGAMMKKGELQSVQEILADIERASNRLKDALVRIRAGGDVKKGAGKTLAEVFAAEEFPE
jgi:hypothetical protein